MSTLAAPRSPSPVSAPLSHPATRAVRDAEAFLDAADARLDGAAGSEPQALRLADGLLLATAAEPQYRRRFIQGCACATGIAGGGCCPGGATSAAVGGMGEMWHARSWALFAAASGKLAFALAAAYSGVKVTRNSDDAGVHLQGVRAVLVGAAHATAIALARVARHNRALTAERRAAPELAAKRGLLLRTQEALVGRQRLLRSALRDVEASLREQRFNRLVPGGLQAGAAAAMGVEAAAHLGVGALGCGVGAMAGAVAAAAFAAYGGALALKHALAWRLDVAAPALPQGGAIPGAYRAAYERHREARCVDARGTALAWAGVAATSVWAVLTAAGRVVVPGAAGVVSAATLVAAGWAMWQNSRTRYAPHLPLSPHVLREHLATPAARAAAYALLRRQDEAIKTAVTGFAALQGTARRVAYTVERLFKPQCGPRAFQVLPGAVQGEGGDRRIAYERLQLEALAVYCEAETALWRGRFREVSEALTYRVLELKRFVDPCCALMIEAAHDALSPARATEGLYTQLSVELRDEAAALERGARRVAVLETSLAALRDLSASAGALSAGPDGPTTPAQEAWLYLRLNLLQLSGTLGEALPKAFIDAHPQHFSRHPAAPLPINTVYVLPEQHAAFARDVAPILDGAFLHAFFNPRRIEAEMDFLLDLEIAEGRDTGVVEGPVVTAPACDSGTCCR